MNLELQRLRKAEHRLVNFLLTEGLGIDRDEKTYKRMTTLHQEDYITFDMVRRIVPGFNIDLSFLQLDFDCKPTLKSLIRCDKQNALIQLLPEFESDCLVGYVFNFDSIRHGLILHNFDLPSDRNGASMFLEVPGCQVRLQRFSEFCLAMRAFDFKLPEAEPSTTVAVSTLLANLTMSNLTSLSIKTLLFFISANRDPEIVRELQAEGFKVEYQTENGESYLSMPHQTLANLIGCDKSSVKRAFADLVERRFLNRKRFGKQIGYRFNGILDWEVVA